MSGPPFARVVSRRHAVFGVIRRHHEVSPTCGRHNQLSKFGMEEATFLGISYGMNEKGGMDKVEFDKCVMNSIVPLYPDSDDVPGKRIMIKVDSGPGRLNVRLVARLRLLGFYLYPGVPNTTAVSQ